MYEKWKDVIAKAKLFSEINDYELISMLNCINPKIIEYNKNEFLAYQGDDMYGIGVVLKGKIAISKDNYDGNRVIIALLEPGNIFGEIAAFSDKKVWPSNVYAQEKCTVMFMPPEKIVGECPNMCISHKLLILNILKIVSNKALNLNRKIEYLSIKSIREKISTFVLEQYSKTKNKTFTITMNRSELADFLNVTRPSLSREMCNMRDEGLIDFHRSSIKILDLEGLKETKKNLADF